MPDHPMDLFAAGHPQFPGNYPKSWTAGQRERAARRDHPATGIGFADNGETCGSCAHSYRLQGGKRSYWKCGLIPVTGGPGTDLRVGWPACELWESVSEAGNA